MNDYPANNRLFALLLITVLTLAYLFLASLVLTDVWQWTLVNATFIFMAALSILKLLKSASPAGIISDETILRYFSGRWFVLNTLTGEVKEVRVKPSSWRTSWFCRIDIQPLINNNSEPVKASAWFSTQTHFFLKIAQNSAQFKQLSRRLAAHLFYLRKGKRPLRSLDLS